jgi:membrane protein DedA with SNARE-associated domain
MTKRTAALALAAVLTVAALALTASGAVTLPSLEPALEDLSETLGPWTYALVAAFAFLETGAFVGFIAPGETAVVLGGVVAAQGKVSLPLMIVLAWSAAALGDLVSFLLGQRLGRRFLHTRGPRLGVTPARLARVEGFYARHGARAVLLGRFVGVIRAVSPFLAGASGLRLRAFLPWSLLGTLVWCSAYIVLGYSLHNVDDAASIMAKVTLGVVVLAAAAVAIARLRDRRRTPVSHQAR